MHDRAGRLLRKTREEKGLTLKDVTMAIGIDGSLLSRWERGRVTQISADMLLRYTRLLELPFEEVVNLLIEDEDAKQAEDGGSAGTARGGAGSTTSRNRR